MKRIYNFSAGPATLPPSVLEEAGRGVQEIASSGMSVLEISHRSKLYESIHFGARDRLLKLMGLDSSQYTVLFVGGGASLQFAMLPMNFLSSGDTADFAHTGEWSAKAMAEAKRFGLVHVASTTAEQKFSRIDKNLRLSGAAKYVHITTNNTIEGTQWHSLPNTGDVPLLADASSDILSHAVDWNRFSMVYAGAQKNLGPAGVTLVVAKKSFLSQAHEQAPTMLQYKTHYKADSLYNTPPVFAIYMVGLVLKWIEDSGGIGAIEKSNREKAKVIYSALDQFPDGYEPAVTDFEDRSLMNITFRLRDAQREQKFLAGAEARGMDGLKGHRNVGGFRASIYNAFPVQGAYALAEYLSEFAQE